MENYTVYKHTSPSGKVYIGITQQKPEYRWNCGKGYKLQQYFYNAIQKYGWDNFKHEILFEGLSKEEACQKEIELIAEYKSNNPEFGYNQSIGGESGSNGYVFTQEVKNRLSEKASGVNNGFYGKHHSEETKQKIREAAKQRDYSNYIGYKHSEDSKIKIGLARKGKKMSQATKLKIANNIRGRKWVNNGILQKLVKVDDLDNYLYNGFTLGMIISRKE